MENGGPVEISLTGTERPVSPFVLDLVVQQIILGILSYLDLFLVEEREVLQGSVLKMIIFVLGFNDVVSTVSTLV